VKAVIIQFTFGIAAFNQQNDLLEKALFSKNPQEAAEKILKTEDRKILIETLSLIKLLQKAGYDAFVFENANVAATVEKKLNVKTNVLKPTESKLLRARAEQIAVETGFVKNKKDLDLWNHNISMELAKLRVKVAIEKRDLVIAQAIQTLDDLDSLSDN